MTPCASFFVLHCSVYVLQAHKDDLGGPEHADDAGEKSARNRLFIDDTVSGATGLDAYADSKPPSMQVRPCTALQGMYGFLPLMNTIVE